jgi:hypothetical protein
MTILNFTKFITTTATLTCTQIGTIASPILKYTLIIDNQQLIDNICHRFKDNIEEDEIKDLQVVCTQSSLVIIDNQWENLDYIVPLLIKLLNSCGFNIAHPSKYTSGYPVSWFVTSLAAIVGPIERGMTNDIFKGIFKNS